MGREVYDPYSCSQGILIIESDKMKVLVTGATGFIGRHVVNELLSSGYDVIATSRNQDRANIFKWYPQVQYIPCDLNDDLDNFFHFFQQPDLLIHLAWEGLPNYTDLFHFEKNLFLNYRFLKNMIIHGLDSIVVTGTCFEYGMQNGSLSENMTTNPQNPYAIAKDTLRKFLEQLQRNHEFSLKWLRLFYIYGEGQNKKSLLPQLEEAIQKGLENFNMSGGEQLRDYLPAKKVAEYIVKIAMQNRIEGIINCCSGVPVSVKKIAEDYLEKTQKSIRLNLGYYSYPNHEPMEFWGCTKKLQSALGEV